MDSATVISLGLLIITGIAAAFAGYQAIQAREARSDAQAASRDSAAAAREAAESSRRSADAAERQAAAAERTLAQNDPWIFEPAGASGHRWKVTNRTHETATMASITSDPGELQLETFPRNIPHGGSFYFQFGGAMTDPANTTIVIRWTQHPLGLRTYSHDVP